MTPNHAHARDRAGGHALANVAQPRLKPARRRGWAGAVAFALGVALVGGAAHRSAAQRPEISVPPTIQARPASQVPLPIKVNPAGSLPSSSFLRLRGFPSSVSLTEGYAIAPGAWAIPLFGLASLKAIVPAGVSGRAEIVITLVDVDGNTLAQKRTALVIASAPQEKAAPAPPRAPPVVALPSVAPPPMKKALPLHPPLSEEAKANAERMLAMGSKQLEQGNIGAARPFLQRAAEVLAEAALMLGATYDPAELPRLAPLATSLADPKEARKWYEKARELGDPEAERRLGRLARR